MFPQKISENIDILAGIHGNEFPWQPDTMGNKAASYNLNIITLASFIFP